MRTTAAWAFWRRLQYYAFFGVVGVVLVGTLYIAFIRTEPTCSDGRENGDESGIDCGGACTRMCAFEVMQPEVEWARSFRIADGQYNAVAYVENRNQTAGTPELTYTFSLYDDAGLITERTGTTVLPPDSVYPIFEGRILTQDRVPTHTFLEIEPPELWLPGSYGREQFTVVERTLSGADSSPRLDATLRNNNLEEAREVEVVATIFDKERNALTSSRTIVENFAPRTETDIVFTWPEPIAKTVRSCEIPTDVVVAIDVSGSMNDDGGTPPEPISSVLAAAGQFVSRLRANDQVSILTFATDAVMRTALSGDKTAAASTVAALTISPREETGSTNTGDAFVRAGEVFAGGAHNADARKVLVLLTDGLATAPGDDPETYAREAAQALKATNVEVYTIGLGTNVNMEFVTALANDAANAYQALTAQDINRIYQTITTSICEDGPAIIEIIPKTEATFENR